MSVVSGRFPGAGICAVVAGGASGVVEGDLRAGLVGRRGQTGRTGGVEPPEEPVVQAVGRSGAQLLLDRLDGCAGLRSSSERGVDVDTGEVEEGGMPRRVPADGAGEVDAIEVPAVAFH